MCILQLYVLLALYILDTPTFKKKNEPKKQEEEDAVLFIGGMRKYISSKIFSLKTHSDISSRNLECYEYFYYFFFVFFSNCSII